MAPLRRQVLRIEQKTVGFDFWTRHSRGWVEEEQKKKFYSVGIDRPFARLPFFSFFFFFFPSIPSFLPNFSTHTHTSFSLCVCVCVLSLFTIKLKATQHIHPTTTVDDPPFLIPLWRIAGETKRAHLNSSCVCESCMSHPSVIKNRGGGGREQRRAKKKKKMASGGR